jgi:hypothetical protein
MPDYAGHWRILDAAARKGGWPQPGSHPGGYGNPAVYEYWSREAGLNHLNGDSRQGPVLEVFYNAGGYCIGVDFKHGVCGKVIASTGDLKALKAKERLAIAEKFILDHPLAEGA